jgi:hypothetical protein
MSWFNWSTCSLLWAESSPLNLSTDLLINGLFDRRGVVSVEGLLMRERLIAEGTEVLLPLHEVLCSVHIVLLDLVRVTLPELVDSLQVVLSVQVEVGGSPPPKDFMSSRVQSPGSSYVLRKEKDCSPEDGEATSSGSGEQTTSPGPQEGRCGWYSRKFSQQYPRQHPIQGLPDQSKCAEARQLQVLGEYR